MFWGLPSMVGKGTKHPKSVLDSFHSEIQGPVFLSVGPDAKLDMLKTSDE